MKLTSITLNNYKSIDNLKIDIKEIDGSFTYALLGINESGKSSILKAISYFEENEIKYPSDFHNVDKPIEITFNYKIEDFDLKEFREELIKKHNFDKELTNKIFFEDVNLIAKYSNSNTSEFLRYESINFENHLFENYTKDETNGKVIKKSKSEDDAFDLETFLDHNLGDYFYLKSHHIVFWQSTPEYLILDDIDLMTFSLNPSKTSIPLKNCFLLAGITSKDIQKEISKLSNSVAINS